MIILYKAGDIEIFYFDFRQRNTTITGDVFTPVNFPDMGDSLYDNIVDEIKELWPMTTSDEREVILQDAARRIREIKEELLGYLVQANRIAITIPHTKMFCYGAFQILAN